VSTTSARPAQRADRTPSVYRTPWPGDPRIQNDHGTAKAHQVRQVLKAIDKKEGLQ